MQEFVHELCRNSDNSRRSSYIVNGSSMVLSPHTHTQLLVFGHCSVPYTYPNNLNSQQPHRKMYSNWTTCDPSASCLCFEGGENGSLTTRGVGGNTGATAKISQRGQSGAMGEKGG